MTAIREQKGGKRKNLLTVCLLIAIASMFAFAVFGSRGVLRILQAEEQKHHLEQQLADLQRQQDGLRKEIERLRTDKNYWEHLARTKLGMVREGELIYHIPDSELDDYGQDGK
jgi:cell division protein FtsB